MSLRVPCLHTGGQPFSLKKCGCASGLNIQTGMTCVRSGVRCQAGGSSLSLPECHRVIAEHQHRVVADNVKGSAEARRAAMGCGSVVSKVLVQAPPSVEAAKDAPSQADAAAAADGERGSCRAGQHAAAPALAASSEAAAPLSVDVTERGVSLAFLAEFAKGVGKARTIADVVASVIRPSTAVERCAQVCLLRNAAGLAATLQRRWPCLLRTCTWSHF